MRTRWKVAVAAGGLLPYVVLQSWFAVQYWRWQPVNVPFHLQSGHFRSSEFVIRASGHYHALISFDRRFSRSSCIYAFPSWDPARRRFEAPDSLDLRWRLLSENRLAASGPIDRPNTFGGARSIATFEAQSGQRYRFEVDIIREPCELDEAHPRLVLESFSAFSEAPAVLLQASLALAVGWLLICLVAMGLSAIRRRHRTRL